MYFFGMTFARPENCLNIVLYAQSFLCAIIPRGFAVRLIMRGATTSEHSAVLMQRLRIKKAAKADPFVMVVFLLPLLILLHEPLMLTGSHSLNVASAAS